MHDLQKHKFIIIISSSIYIISLLHFEQPMVFETVLSEQVSSNAPIDDACASRRVTRRIRTPARQPSRASKPAPRGAGARVERARGGGCRGSALRSREPPHVATAPETGEAVLQKGGSPRAISVPCSAFHPVPCPLVRYEKAMACSNSTSNSSNYSN